MDEFLQSIGIRDHDWIIAIEVVTYVAAWFFCLYWMRALFLARDGIRHLLMDIAITAAALYLVVAGALFLARPLNDSMSSHIIFAIGALFLLFGIIYLRRKPVPRSRAIPRRVRRSVIARDLGDKPFDGSKHHIDHRWPFSLYGSHRPENLRVIDKKKNLKKGAKRPWFWEMWR